MARRPTLEFFYRMSGAKSPPPVTRRALLLLSRPTRFSIDKAERELSWRPEIPVRQGLEEVLQWLKSIDSAAGDTQIPASRNLDSPQSPDSDRVKGG